MRTAVSLLIAIGLQALAPRVARGVEAELHRFDAGGRVDAARALDLDGDGRRDLVLLLTSLAPAGYERQELAWIRIPSEAESERLAEEIVVHRIPLDEGPAARAGALAVGHFGPRGAARIRLFTPDGLHDLEPDGAAVERGERERVPCLLGRSAGRRLTFWSGHADLDGDGVEECWFPDDVGNGRVRIHGGTPATDRLLSLDVFNRAATDEEHLFLRYARIPRLVPADLDGDGTRELVAWDGEALVAWSLAGGEEPIWHAPLPFARTDLGPDEVHTPRLQIRDVNGDRVADLLVTLVMGNRTRLGSFRTRLYHFPGPFFDPETKSLGPAAARIDTASVALHPRFTDIDGDGALDYVSDAITGTEKDLILRVLGQEPTIWYTAYRFDPSQGTFETEPVFKLERPYSREQAVDNQFGISAYFDGDFDGDGLKDMLDLGNLNGFEILGAVRKGGAGVGDPIAFAGRLLPRERVEKPLAANALIADLDANGLADAAVWNDQWIWLALFRRTP